MKIKIAFGMIMLLIFSYIQVFAGVKLLQSPGSEAGTGGYLQWYSSPAAVYTLLFFILLGLFYYIYRKHPIEISPQVEKTAVYAILCAGLLLRLLIAPLIEGFSTDINCFKAWSLAAAKDLPGFYSSGMFCDYPPLYVYVLFIIGKLAGAKASGASFTLLVKLPSILADLATAFLLYRLARKHLAPGLRVFVCAAYVFNPVPLVDSAVWGQVDSFFTMLVVAALLPALDGKLPRSSVLFTMAVLMKPQGVFFLPVLLFELIRRRKPGEFLLSFTYSAVTAIVILAPFTFSQDLLWLPRLLQKTAGQYPYASLNAFNVFALAGANLQDDSSRWFLFSYHTWGMIFDFVLLAFLSYLYIKGRHAALPAMAALVLNTGFFTLSSRMHERYLFPAVALSLLVFILFKDKRLFHLFAALTLTVFLNIHLILHQMLAIEYPHIDPNHPVLRLTSFLNTAFLLYLLFLSVRILIQGKEQPFSLSAPEAEPAHSRKKTSKIK